VNYSNEARTTQANDSNQTRARSASKRDFFIADILRWALKDDRLHGASFFSLSKKAGLSDTSLRT
jgi:lambda repressor-like predicted transcriptional regulator